MNEARPSRKSAVRDESSRAETSRSIASLSPETSEPLTQCFVRPRAIVARLAKGSAKPASNEELFVHDGKADIRIELTARSAGVLEKLKAAGFELVSEKGKTTIVGRIALDKLAALAEIDEVKLILPEV